MSNDVSVVKKNLARRNVRSAEHRAGCNLMRSLRKASLRMGISAGTPQRQGGKAIQGKSVPCEL